MRYLTLLIVLMMCSLAAQAQLYSGSSFPWKVYYDAARTYPTVEVYGVKYGSHDTMTTTNSDDTLATSNRGLLYTRNGKLYYKNPELDIDLKLQPTPSTSKTKYKRKQIFDVYYLHIYPNATDSIGALFTRYLTHTDAPHSFVAK